MNNFFTRVLHEVEPLIKHTLAVLVLLTGLILIGLAVKTLEYMFPAQQAEWTRLESYDLTAAMILLVLYAGFTVIFVCIRLIKALIIEYKAPLSDESATKTKTLEGVASPVAVSTTEAELAQKNSEQQ